MKFNFTIPTDQAPLTVKNLLETQWLVPRKVRHFIRTRKSFLVNGKAVHFQTLVTPGDHITLTLEDSDYPQRVLQLGDVQRVHVLYEDEHLLIVNKPAGIKTHPNQPEETDTLLNHVAAYLAPKQLQPHVVHRLDKETSGAILFAKNQFVLPILGRMLEEKEIYRRYQALVSGKIAHDLVIDKKIGRDRHDRRKRRIDEKGGRSAVTHVRVVTATPTKSQLICQLETGRTHQIRVHLASMGHPIIGDPLYGGKPAPRLMLHALELHLVQPFTRKKISVTAAPGLF